MRQLQTLQNYIKCRKWSLTNSDRKTLKKICLVLNIVLFIPLIRHQLENTVSLLSLKSVTRYY